MFNCTTDELNNKAHELRNHVLNVFEKCHTGHISSSFSCAEILTALFYGDVLRFKPEDPSWDGRDRFILSKGHAGIIYYIILADLGYFDKEEFNRFGKAGGTMGVHVQYTVPGVEITTGSLACGFGIGAGIAHSALLDRKDYFTFVVTGDAECYEGAIWESAMYAAHYNLNNLVVIVDHNHMGCTGFIENTLGIEPLDEKWRSFGFNVKCVNGHSIPDILNALKDIRSRKSSKPLCIIADTVKCKGLPSVENTILCHGYAPKGEELKQARIELNGGAE